LEDLIRHGLHALRETLQQDKELTINNTSIGIIGPSGPNEPLSTESFRILEGEPIADYLSSMLSKEEAMGITPTPAASSAPPTSSDQDVQMGE
jgi:20S proteasome subunit alpha 6